MRTSTNDYEVWCRCKYCGRLISPDDIDQHISSCVCNPLNHTCFTCARLYSDKTIDSDYHDNRRCTKRYEIKNIEGLNCADWREV